MTHLRAHLVLAVADLEALLIHLEASVTYSLVFQTTVHRVRTYDNVRKVWSCGRGDPKAMFVVLRTCPSPFRVVIPEVPSFLPCIIILRANYFNMDLFGLLWRQENLA